MALYWGVPPGVAPGVPPPNGGRGVAPPNGASFALVAAPGAMPPLAKDAGLVNWHSLVFVFSYKVRPSGNWMVFHRGVCPPATGSAAEAVRRSAYSVVIIIATDPVAQFTTGDPVQNADDILPLTSSAILMRLPVGVMFWNASLNALSSAAMTCVLGVHFRLPLSPWPFW